MQSRFIKLMRISLIYWCLVSHSSHAQLSDSLLVSETRKTLIDLKEFIAIPNLGSEAGDINRNLNWLTKSFAKRGFNVTTLPTKERPLFFASTPMDDSKKTVLFYMHFDGQPVDPTLWMQENPYSMVLKQAKQDKWIELNWEENIYALLQDDWRVFGRSVSDDKGPIVMFLHALDILKSQEKEWNYNIKVILDGQEEQGSPHLAKAVSEYKDLLKADYLLIHDGPVHPSGRPTLVYGCRGITSFELTIFGPLRPQHSGHYGNYLPNPAFRLAQLLASFKDEDGKVIIPGYYDNINWDKATAAILEAVPDNEEALLAGFAVKNPEKVAGDYQSSIQYPSLNIRGLSSGWTGEQARTIVPEQATASLDVRLVPETTAAELIQLIRKHIVSKGYTISDTLPGADVRRQYDKLIYMRSGSNTPAFRTPLDSPITTWLERAIGQENLVKIRMMGGTVPIAPFVQELQIPAVIIPVVNSDNNQHSPNENLQIGYVKYGIRTFYQLLSTPIY